MSELLENHPWAKYYADRALSRPPMANLTRSPDAKRTASKKFGAAEPCAPVKQPLSRELEAAIEAVRATPPGIATTPFVTAMQRETAMRVAERNTWIWLTKTGAAVMLGLLALHLLGTRVINREPGKAAIDGRSQDIAAQVLALQSSDTQPLQLSGARVALQERPDSAHLRYETEVILKLREPLYAPAQSNGTLDYRELQQSLINARIQQVKFHLLPAARGAPPPDLPLLLELTHYKDETLVVHVPFAAERIGWQWRLSPAQFTRLRVNHTFDGVSLDHYADAPYLMFGSPASLAEIRVHMAVARDYIIAVNKELHKRRLAGVPDKRL